MNILIFQWMLLLLVILMSESIMTVMFLLHQHSAVQQIQVYNQTDQTNWLTDANTFYCRMQWKSNV